MLGKSIFADTETIYLPRFIDILTNPQNLVGKSFIFHHYDTKPMKKRKYIPKRERELEDMLDANRREISRLSNVINANHKTIQELKQERDKTIKDLVAANMKINSLKQAIKVLSDVIYHII